MRKFNAFEWVVFVLVIVGALNWGLVGFFGFNLVTALFGEMTIVTRVIYDVIGIAALCKIYFAYKHYKE